MGQELPLLLALVVTGAGWILAHLTLLIRTVAGRQVPITLRLLALVPVLTPLCGWLAGARALALLWFASAGVYVALWSLA